VSILIIFGIGITAGLIAAFLGRAERRYLFLHAVVGILGAIIGGILFARLVAYKPYHPNHLLGGYRLDMRGARSCCWRH
jgi:uncharacterized membrane protein YeaQ/YmgE (transglycosylase-associated protein family)